MRVQPAQLVSLGYGKYVRSDEVVALDPIIDDRGPGRRTLVWVRGLPEPLVASRAEGSIVDDLVTPAEEAARMNAQRGALHRIAEDLERVSPSLRRVIIEDSKVNLSDLAAEARRVLG
jgi:hypothetical protein